MKTVEDTNGVVWQYDEHSVVGRGGAGIVYRGHASDGLSVAVKVVEIGSGSLAERIHSREIEIGRKLSAATSRDHLVLHHGFAVADETIWIVMPLASESLRERIKNSAGSMPLAEKIDILCQIASGLQQLAEVAVVHRDLTPGNVLLVDGRWCLTDFGISRDLSERTSTATRRGEGTFEYMAPEYIERGIATAKTDLYSLGIVAYELLTGRKPFEGPDTEDFHRQHLEEMPPPLPEELPILLHRLVGRLLSKEPSGRHADARAVIEALRKVSKPLASPVQESIAVTARRIDEETNAKHAEQARRDRKRREVEDLRKQALFDLDDVVAEATELLRPVFEDQFVYERSPFDEGANWRVIWNEYVMVLAVEFGQDMPPTPTYPLLAGMISTGRKRRDLPKGLISTDTLVANLVYVVENGGAGRWLRRLWGITGSDEKVLSVARLWQLVDKQHEPGPKVLPFISEDEPLTADHIVSDFHTLLGSS
ncbi:serine/threonine-protein kinase [Nocardia sp. CA-119907]|uniref:serine/threonine-protein kinase n=1 Tax=Nocardia sp. CA-119907 TaxID=3239973 RepID=UPI003D98115F